MNAAIPPPPPPRKSFWSYVSAGLVALLGLLGLVLTPFVALLLEYLVFNPGSQESQEALWSRLLSFFPLSLAVAGPILLLSFLVRDQSRAVIIRFARWSKGLKFRSPFTTDRQRTHELEARQDSESKQLDLGYEKRSDEVTAEREDARRKPPSFSVERVDQWHVGEFRLYNRGWKVGNVWLTAPEDEFTFDGDPPVWPGDFGDDSPGGSIGKGFYGLPTEKGLAHGVNFTVAWSWRNLDRDEKLLPVEPSRLLPPPDNK